MDCFIADMIRLCSRCIRQKALATKIELTPKEFTDQWKLYVVITFQWKDLKGLALNILVVTDHFSR